MAVYKVYSDDTVFSVHDSEFDAQFSIKEAIDKTCKEIIEFYDNIESRQGFINSLSIKKSENPSIK